MISASFSRMFIMTVLIFGATHSASGQTEQDCLRSFNVNNQRNVTYIASDPTDRFKVSTNTLSCVDAEKFRERLFISMDKNLYASEQSLRTKLQEATAVLVKLRNDLNSNVDAAKTKAEILGAATTIATLYAITTTAACATAVVDGAGIAACGPAARASMAAVVAWHQLSSHAGTTAAFRIAALAEIQKQEAAVSTILQQINATKAKNMRDNYSALFVGICRAVRQQCL